MGKIPVHYCHSCIELTSRWYFSNRTIDLNVISPVTLPIHYTIQFNTRGKIVIKSKMLHHSNNNLKIQTLFQVENPTLLECKWDENIHRITLSPTVHKLFANVINWWLYCKKYTKEDWDGNIRTLFQLLAFILKSQNSYHSGTNSVLSCTKYLFYV